MKEYDKIQTVFKRDMSNNGKTLLMDQFSLPEFEFLQNVPWVFTEKVDGTNIRVMIEGGRVSFGGKTDNAQIPASLVARLREVFDPLSEKLTEIFPSGGCLYGEGYGPKIQKGGGNYGSAQDFVLFDVKVGEWWLERHNIEDVAAKIGIRVVPIIGEGTIANMVEITRAGITSTWGNFAAEGIVARPKVELRTRNNSRIITKLKTRDFTETQPSPHQYHAKQHLPRPHPQH
jgi:hypothetical protein